MDGGELVACDVDQSRSFLHSSFVPHRRAIDALDSSLRPIIRREPQELFPYRYNEDVHPATTPALLASIPETGGFIAADRARQRPRRIDHPTRAEFLGSTGELRPCCWSAHPSPVGDYPTSYPTSLPHRSIQNSNQGVFDTKFIFPCFDGESHDEDYLDWEKYINDFFYYAGVPLERQLRFVVRKLVGRAAAWWSHLIQARRHENRSEVKTWCKMKRLLRAQFLSVEYACWSNCLQRVNVDDDLVLNHNLKFDYNGKFDNSRPSIVGREQFEERTNCDSVNLREEMAIEMNSSRRMESTIRTAPINLVSQEYAKNSIDSSVTSLNTNNLESSGDSDRSWMVEVLFVEKNSCSSRLSGHVEFLKTCTVETVGSAENNESISHMLGAKGCKVNVLSENLNLWDVSFDVQSPDAPTISLDKVQGLKATFEASSLGISCNGSGESEATCCKTLEISSASYDISSEQISRTPHLLKISLISIVGDKLREDPEALDDVSYVGLLQVQAEPLLDGAFQGCDCPAKFHSCGNARLLNSDSRTSYQVVVFEKHD